MKWFFIGTLVVLAGCSIIRSNLPEHQLALEYWTKAAQADSTQGKNLRAYQQVVAKRLGKSQSLDEYHQALEQASAFACASPDPAAWQLVGPYVAVGSSSPSCSVPSQYCGFVFQALGDPRNLGTNPTKDLIAGTEVSGLWRYEETSPGYWEWINKTDPLNLPGLGITEIIRDSGDPDFLLASTGYNKDVYVTFSNSAGLLKSEDNGDTWSAFTPMFANFSNKISITKVVDDSYPGAYDQDLRRHFFITTLEGGFDNNLWEYRDFYWIDHKPNLPGLPNQRIFDFEVIDFNKYLLSTINPFSLDPHLYLGTRSASNNIIQWTEITSSLPVSTINFQKIFIARKVDNEIWIRTSKNKFFKSTDNAVTWQAVTINTTRKDEVKLELTKSALTNNLYIAGLQPSHYNTVSSTIQNYCTGHDDVRDIEVLGESGGKEWVVMANDGGVSLVEVDMASGTASYQMVNGESFPIHELQGIGISQSSEEFIVTGANHNHSFKFQDGQWMKIGCGDGGDAEVNYYDNETYYHTCNPRLYRNTSWVYSNNYWFTSRPIEMDRNNPKRLFFTRSGTTSSPAELIQFDQSAGVLSSQVIPVTDFVVSGAIGLAKTNDQVIYLADDGTVRDPAAMGKLIKTTDGGATYSDLSNSPVYSADCSTLLGSLRQVTGWIGIGDIEVNPYNENTIYVTFTGSVVNAAGLQGSTRRVYRSTDGGNSFCDYSQGLPGLPINCITYQENSNDRLFVGTDVGVYYRDNSMGQWECFNEGLPISFVTDLDINYCTNTIYAATYGRSAYKSTLANLPADDHVLEIPSGAVEIWNFNRILNSDLIIRSGATLIVEAGLKVGAGRSIIVEPTAKLIIDGGTITSLCDEHWQGIQVHGNIASALEADQGRLELKNGATLSNAKEAVRLHNPNDYATHGGIVVASNSKFINNWRNAEFLDYPHPYHGRAVFSNCEFILNDQIPSSFGAPSVMLTMWAVDGVEFRGCLFEDQRNNFNNPPNGIFALDAGYEVDSYCGGTVACPKKSVFRNLNRGISTNNGNSLLGIEIRESVFENNNIGVYLNNIHAGAVLVKNKFLVGKPSPPSGFFSINADFGLSLQNTGIFIVEDNYFERGSTYDSFNFGAAIVDAGPFSNNVYRNTFKGFRFAVLTQGVNSLASNNPIFDCLEGLQFTCNTNMDNEYDLLLTDVKKEHGSVSLAAGNSFSPGATVQLATDNGCGLEYNAYSGAIEQIPTTTSGPVIINTTGNSNACISNWNDDNWESRLWPSQDDESAVLASWIKSLSAFQNPNNQTGKRESNTLDVNGFHKLLFSISRSSKLDIKEKNAKIKTLLLSLAKAPAYQARIEQLIKQVLEQKTEPELLEPIKEVQAALKDLNILKKPKEQ